MTIQLAESWPLLDRPAGWDETQRGFGDTKEIEESYKAMCREQLAKWEDYGLFSKGRDVECRVSRGLLLCRIYNSGVYRASQRVVLGIRRGTVE